MSSKTENATNFLSKQKPVEWQVGVQQDGNLSIRFRLAPGQSGDQRPNSKGEDSVWESYTIRAVSMALETPDGQVTDEQKHASENTSDMLCQRLLHHHMWATSSQARKLSAAPTIAKEINELQIKKETLALQVEKLQDDLEKQMESYLATLEDRAEAMQKANNSKYAAIEVQALRKKIKSNSNREQSNEAGAVIAMTRQEIRRASTLRLYTAAADSDDSVAEDDDDLFGDETTNMNLLENKLLSPAKLAHSDSLASLSPRQATMLAGLSSESDDGSHSEEEIHHYENNEDIASDRSSFMLINSSNVLSPIHIADSDNHAAMKVKAGNDDDDNKSTSESESDSGSDTSARSQSATSDKSMSSSESQESDDDLFDGSVQKSPPKPVANNLNSSQLADSDALYVSNAIESSSEEENETSASSEDDLFASPWEQDKIISKARDIDQKTSLYKEAMVYEKSQIQPIQRENSPSSRIEADTSNIQSNTITPYQQGAQPDQKNVISLSNDTTITQSPEEYKISEKQHAEALAVALQNAKAEHEAAMEEAMKKQALEFAKQEEANIKSVKSSLTEAHHVEMQAIEQDKAARAIQNKVRATQTDSERKLAARELRTHMKSLMEHAEEKHTEALAAALQNAKAEHEAAMEEAMKKQALEFAKQEEANIKSVKIQVLERDLELANKNLAANCIQSWMRKISNSESYRKITRAILKNVRYSRGNQLIALKELSYKHAQQIASVEAEQREQFRAELQEKELVTQNLLEKERKKVEKQSESVREKYTANMLDLQNEMLSVHVQETFDTEGRYQKERSEMQAKIAGLENQLLRAQIALTTAKQSNSGVIECEVNDDTLLHSQKGGREEIKPEQRTLSQDKHLQQEDVDLLNQRLREEVQKLKSSMSVEASQHKADSEALQAKYISMLHISSEKSLALSEAHQREIEQQMSTYESALASAKLEADATLVHEKLVLMTERDELKKRNQIFEQRLVTLNEKITDVIDENAKLKASMADKEVVLNSQAMELEMSKAELSKLQKDENRAEHTDAVKEKIQLETLLLESRNLETEEKRLREVAEMELEEEKLRRRKAEDELQKYSVVSHHSQESPLAGNAKQSLQGSGARIHQPGLSLSMLSAEKSRSIADSNSSEKQFNLQLRQAQEERDVLAAAIAKLQESLQLSRTSEVKASRSLRWHIAELERLNTELEQANKIIAGHEGENMSEKSSNVDDSDSGDDKENIKHLQAKHRRDLQQLEEELESRFHKERREMRTRITEAIDDAASNRQEVLAMMTKLDAHKQTVGELKKRLKEAAEEHETNSKKLKMDFEAKIKKCKQDEENALTEARNQHYEQLSAARKQWEIEALEQKQEILNREKLKCEEVEMLEKKLNISNQECSKLLEQTERLASALSKQKTLTNELTGKLNAHEHKERDQHGNSSASLSGDTSPHENEKMRNSFEEEKKVYQGRVIRIQSKLSDARAAMEKLVLEVKTQKSLVEEKSKENSKLRTELESALSSLTKSENKDEDTTVADDTRNPKESIQNSNGTSLQSKSSQIPVERSKNMRIDQANEEETLLQNDESLLANAIQAKQPKVLLPISSEELIMLSPNRPETVSMSPTLREPTLQSTLLRTQNTFDSKISSGKELIEDVNSKSNQRLNVRTIKNEHDLQIRRQEHNLHMKKYDRNLQSNTNVNMNQLNSNGPNTDLPYLSSPTFGVVESISNATFSDEITRTKQKRYNRQEELRRSHYVERLLGVSPIRSPRSKVLNSQTFYASKMSKEQAIVRTPVAKKYIHESSPAEMTLKTPASVISDSEYFTPKIIRAAEERLEHRNSTDDITNEDNVQSDSPEQSRGFDYSKSASLRKGKNGPAERSGNHFWFGCGKLKKKVEAIRVKTMRLRAEISSRSLAGGGNVVPHPDKWIKANIDDANIVDVTDEHAYWHGCAKCAWELAQHKRIYNQAQQILDIDDRRVRSRREDSLYLV